MSVCVCTVESNNKEEEMERIYVRCESSFLRTIVCCSKKCASPKWHVRRQPSVFACMYVCVFLVPSLWSSVAESIQNVLLLSCRVLAVQQMEHTAVTFLSQKIVKLFGKSTCLQIVGHYP